MESVIIPVSQGGFVAATLWQRHKAKALVIVHPATAVVQGFYKGFAEYLYKRGFSVITYDYRGTGLSKSGRVRHNKNTMSDWIEQDVGCITAWAKARAPGLTLLAIGHSIGGHAVLLFFRLHRPASRRHGCLTRRRDKHYQPNEGKAASMVLTARFGAGTLPALWVYASQTSRAG